MSHGIDAILKGLQKNPPTRSPNWGVTAFSEWNIQNEVCINYLPVMTVFKSQACFLLLTEIQELDSHIVYIPYLVYL